MAAKRTSIGTDNYYLDISRRTIFDGAHMTSPKTDFVNRLKTIAGNASKGLVELYDDLEKNKLTVRFFERGQISNVTALAKHLYEATRFASVSVRRSDTDVRSKLSALALPSRYSMSDVKKMADMIRSGKNKAPSSNQEKELFAVALSYAAFDKSKSNKGKNGKILGTQEYAEEMAGSVFCDSFVRSSDYKWTNSYKDMIQKQIAAILKKFAADVKSKVGSDEYMEYPERDRMMAIVNDLRKRCSGNPAYGLGGDLLKLRRLEDYNNKVIEINRTGNQYPVEAVLKWQNGKTKLELTAKIRYANEFPLLSIPEFEDRKTAVEDELKTWAGTWKVFKGQIVDVDVKTKEAATLSNALTVFFHSFGERPMCWGGVVSNNSPLAKAIGTTASTLVAPIAPLYAGYTAAYPVLHMLDWRPDTQNVMFLPSGKYDGSAASDRWRGVARHEFGHALGLGDAYDPDPDIPFLYYGEGIDVNDPKVKTMATNPETKNIEMAMLNYGGVRDIEIEMVILAFSNGKRQNFEKQAYYQDVSQAIKEAIK